MDTSRDTPLSRMPKGILRWAVVLAALLGGCATLSGPPPLTSAEVVAMAKAGEPAQAIIQKLHETGTVLALSASDIVRLHEAGVPPEVLDYLQASQISEIRRREALFSSMYPYPGFAPFYGCSWRFRFYPYGPLGVGSPWGC